MLEDRDYMRSDYRPRRSWAGMPGHWLLILVLVGAFALQQINIAYFGARHQLDLYLSADVLRRGFLWQLITFQFLHAGLLHLIFNCLGIWCFGRFVEERLGKAHFFKVYFLSGFVGGILQSALMVAFPAHFGSYTVGASAGVCALVAVFAMIDPEATILAFLFVPLRARTLLYVEGGIALFFVLVPSDPFIAHGAHLGGMLFAMAYVRWGLNASQLLEEWNPLKRKQRSERMVKAATVPEFSKLRRRPRAEETPELPSEEFISKQVDPILDKISAQGMQSLTEKEREILQAARKKMSKR